jgi:hypothetical protein
VKHAAYKARSTSNVKQPRLKNNDDLPNKAARIMPRTIIRSLMLRASTTVPWEVLESHLGAQEIEQNKSLPSLLKRSILLFRDGSVKQAHLYLSSMSLSPSIGLSLFSILLSAGGVRPETLSL